MSDKTTDLINEYLTDITGAYKGWMKAAKNDIDYALGDQWSKKDKVNLKLQGRTPLTFNKIIPIINLVSGYQRQNRMDIKCIGVEGGDDFIAEIMTLLIKNIMTRNYGEYKITQMFDSGILSSKGWIELDEEYEDDITGQIRLYNGMYNEIFPDPNYREYDMHRDAEFLIKKLKLSRSKIINMFPEKERKIKDAKEVTPEIEELEVQVEGDYYSQSETERQGQAEPNEGEPPYTPSERSQLLTLIECWYRKYEKKKLAVDLISGEVKDITHLNLTIRDQKEMVENIDGLGILNHRVGVPYMATMLGDTMLQEEIISPYADHMKEFPVVPYVSNFYPLSRNPEKSSQSIVRALKDPQNEINKRRTKLLEIISSVIWVGDDDALTGDGWIELEKDAASPRLVLRKKKGTDLHREPSALSGETYLRLIREDSEVIKTISGINTDLLGMQDKTVSGKAMLVRQQAGLMVIQHVFDNLRYSRHILGRLLIGMILNSYRPDKIVRICGEEKMSQNPWGIHPIQAAEEVLNNVNLREYDIAIDDTQLSPVMRMAVLEELRAMRQEGIIPPGSEDLIIDASDLPNRQEIKARIQEAMQMARAEAVPQR